MSPRAVLLAVGLIVASALVSACRGGAPGRDVRGAAPEKPPASARERGERHELPRVVLHPSRGGAVSIGVEIAETPEARARGLMFRRELAEDRGMLFVFPEEGHWPFYMRNTYIPLDLIYLDAEGRVVGIVANMRPMDLTPRGIDHPARYAIEVNAHTAARIGLEVGDKVSIIGGPSWDSRADPRPSAASPAPN